MKSKYDVTKMREFFMDIWKKRKRNCESCGKSLGREPMSYMFDHLLEKNKYPSLAYDENNICLMCLECHDNKTRGFMNTVVRDKLNKVKHYYERLKQGEEE